MADNSNPGNFANRPKEEVQNIASKGGQTGTENSGVSPPPPSLSCTSTNTSQFASMDADKQKDIASMGGKASSGSFEKGSEAAKEAGRKGGQSS